MINSVAFRKYTRQICLKTLNSLQLKSISRRTLSNITKTKDPTSKTSVRLFNETRNFHYTAAFHDDSNIT